MSSSNANVKSFIDKLKHLLGTINSTLDEWTTKTKEGKPTITNGSPVYNIDGITPLKPWLTSSLGGFFTGVPDRITTLLQDRDIATVRYKATNRQPGVNLQPDVNPLFNTLNLLVFGIAYKRNINLVTDQLDFIVKAVLAKTIFGKKNNKYSKFNVFSGDPLNVDLNHTLKELTDNDLLFFLMNKIDASMWRGQSVWYEPAKQWGIVGSDLVQSSSLPNFDKDPLGYVIKIHGFLLNRWLSDADVDIAKEVLIYAIQNPSVSNNNFYKYVQQNMNNRFYKKGKYAPPVSAQPSTPPVAAKPNTPLVKSNNLSAPVGGSRKKTSYSRK